MREFVIIAFLHPSGLQSGFWDGGKYRVKPLLDVGRGLLIFASNGLPVDTLSVHTGRVTDAAALQPLRHIVANRYKRMPPTVWRDGRRYFVLLSEHLPAMSNGVLHRKVTVKFREYLLRVDAIKYHVWFVPSTYARGVRWHFYGQRTYPALLFYWSGSLELELNLEEYTHPLRC